MENKTITMDYTDYLKMVRDVEEYEELKKEKVMVLDIAILDDNPYLMFEQRGEKVRVHYSGKEEFEKETTDVFYKVKNDIEQPLKHNIKTQEYYIEKLKEKMSKKKWYEFIPMKEK